MPKLECGSSNNHPDSKVSFEINFLDEEKKSNELWISYEIVINCGRERQVFRSIDKEEMTHTGIMGRVGHFAFALKPKNEIAILVQQIEKFLNDKERLSINFEPADPSFELIIERTHGDEYKVYLWIDCGNTTQLEYTWDARGIRFITTEDNIRQFLTAIPTMESF